MTTIQRLSPVGGQYSKAVVASGVAYLAGLIAEDWDLDIGGQSEQIFSQIDELLAQAGTSKSNLLSVSVFLRDFADYAAFKSAYAAWADPENLAARATVRAELLDPRLKIEIVATALLPPMSAQLSAAGLVKQAHDEIEMVSVAEALATKSAANLFVDVREDSEVASGKIPGALHIARGNLEFALDPTHSAHNAELKSGRRLVFVCGSGGRAALATRLARAFSYDAVCLDGGMKAWREAGAPIETPR